MSSFVPGFLMPKEGAKSARQRKGANAPWEMDGQKWEGLPLMLAEVDMGADAAADGNGAAPLSHRERLAQGMALSKSSAQFLEFYVTPEKHATYAFTWGILSVCCAALTYFRFFHVSPAARMAARRAMAKAQAEAKKHAPQSTASPGVA